MMGTVVDFIPPPDEPIPVSALQHALYCLRQAALIHLERQWEENRLTAEGRVLHEAADEPSARLRGRVRVVTALPIANRTLGIAGQADRVEFRKGPEGETAYPVEYKRGRPKTNRADEVQLCAQALCLEEMTGRPVPEGALFYAEPRRRLAVAIDDDLRRLTVATIQNFAEVLRSGRTPPARYSASLCRACSLIDKCRPKLAGRSARGWLSARLDEVLAADGTPP